MKKIGFFLLISLLFVGEGFAQRQNKWRNYLDVTAFQNTDLVKSGDNLWIGTSGGLLRYNTMTGQHHIFQPDTCAMKGVKVTAICSDSMGGVWFATNLSGLQHFDGTTFRWWPTKNNGEALYRLRKIQLDKQGRLWMLHQNYEASSLSYRPEILMFQGGQWTSFARDSIAFDSDFAVDKDGVCWSLENIDFPNLRTKVLAFDSRNQQITRFDTLNSPLKLVYGNALLRADNVGNVWATYKSNAYPINLFLQQLNLQSWRTYTFRNDRNFSDPLDFNIDNQGGMHIINGQYYFTFQDSSWLQRGTGDYFYRRLLSANATKWAIGTTSIFGNTPYFLIKIDGSNQQAMSFKSDKTLINTDEKSYQIFGNDTRTTDLHCRTFDFDGQRFKPNQLIGSQGAFDGDSLLWTAGLDYIEQFDFRRNRSETIATERIYTDKVLVDKFANKWIKSSIYKGLYMLTPNRTLSFFDMVANNLGSSLQDFAIDTAGNIFALTGKGIVKRSVQTQAWSVLPFPEALRGYGLSKINIDEGNHIWLNANGFCALYSERDGAERLDYNQVSFNRPNNFENEFDRFVTYRNRVWWFAARNGLVRYDGVSYLRFDATNSPMATKNITGVFTDKLGNLWMNHPYGLTVFNENNLVDLVTSTKDIAQKPTTDIAHQLFPNPLSNQGILRFDNPQNQLFELQIFNANGQMQMQQKTAGHQFLIDNTNFTQGIYFYVLKNEGKTGRGKFVVP